MKPTITMSGFRMANNTIMKYQIILLIIILVIVALAG